jgi:type IV pilus assembly protein PilA
MVLPIYIHDMKNFVQNLQKRTRSEDGFSLIEIVVAMVILGILAAIAIPIFINQQNAAATAEVKSDLIQAASQIEQEKIDNNGLYPTYLPNELTSNPKWKDFPYTYSDNRLVYCLQGSTLQGKYFVSSTSKTPTQTVCTQNNLAKGSATP